MYVQYLSACWIQQSLGQSFLISWGFNTNAIMDESWMNVIHFNPHNPPVIKTEKMIFCGKF